MENEHKYKETHPEIFLFINSASGGGLGKDMIDQGVTHL